MVIVVDFDGTIVEHAYPKIGRELPFATETLRMLQKDKHKLILWTVREGALLQEAVDWCKERGVEFYAVNSNYPEETHIDNENFTRKLNADYIIDDRCIGGLPEWGYIYRIITEGISYEDLLREQMIRRLEDVRPEEKRKWWKIF